MNFLFCSRNASCRDQVCLSGEFLAAATILPYC
jgi:hypothetical protein